VRDEFKTTFAPTDMFDYIYAAIFSGNHRKWHESNLPIDSSQIPCPKDSASFWKRVSPGREIRKVHLGKRLVADQPLVQFPIDDDNLVERIKYEEGKVFISDVHYFTHVPLEVWHFYLGGVQPAQKWLYDRMGKRLDVADIQQYQSIISILSETNRLMKDIDDVEY